LKHIALFIIALLSVSACGGGGGGGSPSTPSTPAPANVIGNYTGTSSDSSAGKGVLSVSFTSETGSQVSGYWGVAYASFVNGGSFSGSVNGNTVQGTATSNVSGGCSATITGTLSGSTFSGSYAGTGAGCTSDTGTFAAQSVTVPTLGNYAGTLNDSIAGSASVQFSLTQNAVFLAGTWSDSFANPSNNTSGAAYGLVTSGSTVVFYLVPSSPAACRLVASGTITGSTIAGNYAAVNCSVSETGTFSVTLQ
jgi:hypothetical protein